MSWNGSGTYVLPPAYTPEVNGALVDATRYNGATTDIAGGITAALAKNGENAPSNNLPMAGNKHTGAGAATAIGQYLVYGQVSAVLDALSVTNAFSATSVTAATVTVNTTLTGAGVTTRLATPGPIGNTTPSTGAFTTLSASSTVSGVGFSTYLASPPAIGGTAQNTIASSFVQVGTGAQGQIRLVNGAGPTTGYVDFIAPTALGGNRQGYIGASTGSGATDTGTIPYVAGTHAFFGTVTGVTPTAAVGTNTGDFASTAYAYAQAFGNSTWQDVTGSRAKGTTYTNSTGKPIAVNVTGTASTNGARYQFTISGVVVGGCATQNVNQLAISVVVPPGATYTLADGFGSNAVVAWTELR